MRIVSSIKPVENIKLFKSAVASGVLSAYDSPIVLILQERSMMKYQDFPIIIHQSKMVHHARIPFYLNLSHAIKVLTIEYFLQTYPSA